MPIENRALRQQFLVLDRTDPRPQIRHADRVFRVLLLRWWSARHRPLQLVTPQTIIASHRRIWRFWWFWWWRKSRSGAGGRPQLNWDMIKMIRRISKENPTWGAPRIHGEMLKLGYDLGEATVSRYMLKRRDRPTQNWKTFFAKSYQ